MKLKLLVNIGSIDNQKLGLKKTKEGDTVDVPDEKIANYLKAKGWAASPDADGPETTPAAAAAAGDRPPTGSAEDEDDKKKKHR